MAAVLEITVDKGYRFDSDEWTWCNPILPLTDPVQADPNSPVDLTGYHARLQFRESPGDANPALVTLTDDPVTSDPGGGIVLGGPAGTVAFYLLASLTDAWDFQMAYGQIKLIPPTGEDDAILLVEIKLILRRSETV